MNQSKIFFVLASIIVFLNLNCCDVDKLELTNPNELTPETYFKTEAQVQKAVNAVYATMQPPGLYQRTIFFAMDNMAYEQVMNPASEADKRQYSNYTLDANHGAIGDYWKNCYAGINRANFIINNEEKIGKIPEGLLSKSKKDKYIGEAQFLRALYYFLLVIMFGDIPLITEIPDGETGLPRSPKALVWAQIETDLTAAAEKCFPKNIEEKGRATSGAVWALLGTAHLFQANASNDQANYIAAKNAFLHIINDTIRFWDGKTEVWYRYGWRKYQNYYKQKYENYSYSGINTKVIRFADVLLMMAEIENELGNIPEAIDYLNQVRNRADVMMPNYGTPAMDAIYPVSNKDQLRKVIEHERKIELCSEQVRFNDLVRWRRLEAFLNDEVKPGLTSFQKNTIQFDPAIYYLWPIPQAEIDLNPALTEADQNPGY